MRPFRLSFHPLLLAVIGIASGALALGASTLGPRQEGGAAPAPLHPAAKTVSYSLGARAMGTQRRLWFPAMFAPETGTQDRSYDILPPRVEDRSLLIPTLANNQILAFYGKPDSRRMGILGEYPKEELAKLLEAYSRLYDQQNGDEGVVPAFYLIYGTCWPEGEIGYLRDSVVQDYIEFARARGMLVFVDHQIGRYPVADAVKRLLPWLKYPNVHIALDPEWRTEAPMKVIGAVDAEEINAAQEAMSDYMKAEGIPGVKMLVVHQFQERMIADRDRVRADYDGVLLIHTADGFGPPALKRHSYSANARAGNLPLKGFKLFFKTEVEGAGYDDPLLLPAEVLALEPRPRLVIYQ
jgi:hypothetical protein